MFYYVTSVLNIKQKSHFFMTSILDINIEKVKQINSRNVLNLTQIVIY